MNYLLLHKKLPKMQQPKRTFTVSVGQEVRQSSAGQLWLGSSHEAVAQVQSPKSLIEAGAPASKMAPCGAGKLLAVGREP